MPVAGLPKLSDRASGVLLHPTSLPGGAEGGQLDGEARAFVDFLSAAGQSWWQTLPVGPTGYANSPYSAQSAFAGHPGLVAVDRLVDDGLVAAADRGRRHDEVLRAAFAAFRNGGGDRDRDFRAFTREAAGWLDDFALYRAIKRAHGETQWTLWPAPLRDRRPRALADARATLADEIAFVRFVQWRFARDWRALRDHAHARGVGLIGDIPIFMAPASADAGMKRDSYHLGPPGRGRLVAAFPPAS